MESEGEAPIKGYSTRKYIVFFMSEFLGTAIMMYVGCLGCALEIYKPLQPLVVASTFAFAIMTSIQAFGHVSAQLNPGVSLGCLMLGRIDWKKMIVFWAGQYTGAFFGYGLMWVQLPESSKLLKPCALAVKSFSTPLQTFLLEFTGSAILFLVVGGATDAVNKKWHDAECVRLGFMIYGLVVALGEVSGAGLNSARALPSAVFNNEFTGHYVYHAGPVLGQVFGAVVYKYIFDTKDKFSLNRDEEMF